MKKEVLKIGLIFIVTVATVVFGLYSLYGGGASQSTKASGETMALSFNTETVTAAIDTDFTTTLKVKPSVNAVLRGYKVKVNFDKTKIKFKTIVYKLGVVSAGLGDTNAKMTAINERGYIEIIGEDDTATGKAVTATDGAVIATITFTALSTTGNTISTPGSQFFSITENKSLFAGWAMTPGNLSVNGGGPTMTPGGPTVTGGQTGAAKLKLKLKFQGIAGKPADAFNKLSVKVKLLNEATEAVTDYKSADFVADAAGIWTGEVSFNVNPSSRYVVYAKGQFHIQKKICDEKPVETAAGTYRCDKGKITLNTGNNNLDFSGIILLAGDLPIQDGSVTAYDTSLVRNNLGKTDADAVSKADVNRDGKVDTQDYSLIIAALSVRNDE
ncbi:MAG: hypothetical protein UR68_C0040G0015 [Candidatus Roizmanbacteria bacterium GW2011_GWA2_35_19]|uniref:Dockerin domain-containing protein n=2 Tax=Candidatus Roizmaniibacteriota TaxID=1752723 RepID=A0A0G0BMI6_9BACT|nr:MAG: hypothetical protein UR63_C0021G0003 [Candidatus Roizmanbacteria bacterium GW2011_GWC2_35_12]KKP70628.1 MAG: hypothetical protein UR68_C0040G0015 [Candidatus Roizmanbacteria bacterium GW2011_GWA2_35_19]